MPTPDIPTTYTSQDGQSVTVCPEAIEEIRATLDSAQPKIDRESEAASPLLSFPSILFARQSSSPFPIEIQLDPSFVHQASVVLILSNSIVHIPIILSVAVSQCVLSIPPGLPIGYHTLEFQLVQPSPSYSPFPSASNLPNSFTSSTLLCISPPALPSLASREWGFMLQLYAIRSRESWGLGDLRDLQDVATWSAHAHGAGFVLINPLFACGIVPPLPHSPYFAGSREFLNPIYLCVESIPEYALLSDKQRAVILPEITRLKESNTTVDLLDRDAVWTTKMRALAFMYAHPLPHRTEMFDAFCGEHGDTLENFATWCAIAEIHSPKTSTWPSDLQAPTSPGVKAFQAAHADRIRFHAWLQWLADEQVLCAHHSAREEGMSIGIIHDLPVGVDPDGPDAWCLAQYLVRDVRLGVPPGTLNKHGEDWGLAPWNFQALAAAGYAPFRRMLRRLLARGGGVRIDHGHGLFRQWWIPKDRPACEGAYVRLDHEALLSILAAEAHLSGTVVIAEDVGTSEPFMSDELAARGILGTDILLYASQRDPSMWRTNTLLTVAVHDMPPVAGFLRNMEVTLRHSAGLLHSSLEEEIEKANSHRREWLSTLKQLGCVGEDVTDMTDEGLDAIALGLYRACGLSRARLIGVGIGDVVGDRTTQNIPGTDQDTHPNWRFPLMDAEGKRGILLEEIFAMEERVQDFVVAVCGEGKGGGRGRSDRK